MVITLAVDRHYAGFYVKKTHKAFSIYMGYAVLRFFNTSEINVHRAFIELGASNE